MRCAQGAAQSRQLQPGHRCFRIGWRGRNGARRLRTARRSHLLRMACGRSECHGACQTAYAKGETERSANHCYEAVSTSHFGRECGPLPRSRGERQLARLSTIWASPWVMQFRWLRRYQMCAGAHRLLRSLATVEDFSLNVGSARLLPPVAHTRQALLQLAEPIFRGLCRHALYDHAVHQRFLLRDLVEKLADVAIGGTGVIGSRH